MKSKQCSTDRQREELVHGLTVHSSGMSLSTGRRSLMFSITLNGLHFDSTQYEAMQWSNRRERNTLTRT
jgi:hypothetical protein